MVVAAVGPNEFEDALVHDPSKRFVDDLVPDDIGLVFEVVGHLPPELGEGISHTILIVEEILEGLGRIECKVVGGEFSFQALLDQGVTVLIEVELPSKWEGEHVPLSGDSPIGETFPAEETR